MRKATLISLSVFGLFLLSTDLIAQEKSQLKLGSRIRVLVQDTANDWLNGSLLSLNVDTVVLKFTGLEAPVAIPVSTITKLEVSMGRKHRAGKGSGVGFLVGAVSGFVIMAMVFAGQDDYAMETSFFGAGIGAELELLPV